MSQALLTHRSQRVASMPAATLDEERAVLRLERQALRADPPTVRFIARSGPATPQGVLPWRAYD